MKYPDPSQAALWIRILYYSRRNLSVNKFRIFLTFLHVILSVIAVVYLHYFVAIVLPDRFRKIIYPFQEFYFEVWPFLALILALVVTYPYMKVVRVDAPFRKALLSTLIGSVLFWGSCIGLLCAIAPGFRNM